MCSLSRGQRDPAELGAPRGEVLAEEVGQAHRVALRGDEVHEVQGLTQKGDVERVRITPRDSDAANYAFDVTPARLVTGLVTERGICPATEAGLLELYPEQRLDHQNDIL